MNRIFEGIKTLKSEFSQKYQGTGHLHEIIPLERSEVLPIEDTILEKLHKFARCNPIYFEKHEREFLNVPCMVYEADINQYWLDSIKHDASYQSFYPTWILSAFALAMFSEYQGFKEAIDIGSGDGRISYCTACCGIKSSGFEIDQNLVGLQKCITSCTLVKFEALNEDATQFDFAKLRLSKPVFFISGLPEMGGEILAECVLSFIANNNALKNAGLFLMGKTNSDDNLNYGWKNIIDKFELNVKDVIWLPTHWTTEQKLDTPHIFVSF